jgi:hypothetical protein
MLLQLTGRLDPGETYALVDLEGAELVAHSAPPSLDYAEFELVNIVICQRSDHNHFEAFPPQADYPLQPDGWKAKIKIKVPRPLPLVHRRRTRYFTFPEDPEPTVGNPPPIKRFKRSPQPAPRVVPLTAYQVEYRARFSVPTLTAHVGDPAAMNTVAKVIKQLHNTFRPKIEKHFQRLLLTSPSFELNLAESTRRNLYKIKITLPAQTRLLCSHKDYLVLLGFGSQIVQESLIGNTDLKWGLVNTSRTEAREFLSDEPVETATIHGVLLTTKRLSMLATENLYFYFERSPYNTPNTYLNFAEEAMCLQNPPATAYFFQLLLDCVVQMLSLPRQSLRVRLDFKERKNWLFFFKDTTLEATDDLVSNFNIYARFGTEIMEKLGLKNPSIIIRFAGEASERSYVEININEAETEEELDSCRLVMSNLMQEQFYNQTGGVREITNLWQQTWQDVVTRRKNLSEAEAERQRVVAAAAEAEAERKRQESVSAAAAAAAAAAERKRIAVAAAAAAAESERKRIAVVESEKKQSKETGAGAPPPPPPSTEEAGAPPSREEEEESGA